MLVRVVDATNFFLCGALLSAFFAFLTVGASAQIPPATDPGEQQLRQQERELQLRRQIESASDVWRRPAETAQVPRLPVDESPCVLIARIELAGDMAKRFASLLDSVNDASDGVEDKVTGRCIGSVGIGIAMRRLQNELMRRGYVTTRVLAAPQALDAGVLTLTLIPGRVRAIRFAEGTSSRATKWNAAPLQPGELLNLRALEQALENFKRVPSADADIRIEPAVSRDARPGDSDVVLGWRQDFPWRVNLSADNSGLKSTGRYQGALTLSLDHALTLNDLFYVSVNRSLFEPSSGPRATEGNVVHYSLPFGYWLLGATASNSEYQQPVASQHGTTVYSGESANRELKLSRVLARSATRKTSGYLSAWARQSDNDIGGMQMRVQHRQTGGWEAGLAHREILGNATLDLNATYRRGTGAFGAARLVNEDSEGSTRLQLLQVGALYNLPFVLAGRQVRYTLALRAQHAWTALQPQDRFSIGSRFSVRGFDEQRVLSADHGWLIRNDLGFSLGGSGQEAYIGLDYGAVRGRHSELLAGTQLAGMAIGLRGVARGVVYDVFAGRALCGPEGFYDNGLNLGFSLSWSH